MMLAMLMLTLLLTLMLTPWIMEQSKNWETVAEFAEFAESAELAGLGVVASCCWWLDRRGRCLRRACGRLSGRCGASGRR